MHKLPWNLCTTFAASGAAVAYLILLAFFGLYWQLVPGALAGLVAAYVASTALGFVAQKIQLGRYPVAGIVVSVGFAWCTLFAGALAISLTNFFVAIVGGLLLAPSGQPTLNVLAEIAPGHGADLIKTPLAAGMWFGLVPAALFGIVYGISLRRRLDSSLVDATSTRKIVRGATGLTLLVPLLLAVTLVGIPVGGPGPAARYANIPIAIRGCRESAASAGVEATCWGAPCARGECDWEVEQDAFVVYVRPPAGSSWQWVGGGIGTTQRLDSIRHNLHWAQREPDGSLSEGSPLRYASYELVFEDGFVNVGAQRFIFEPGMRLDIQFLQDWSVVASEGHIR